MSGTNEMDQAILKTKKVAELREIAKAFGVPGYQSLKKADLVNALAGGAVEAETPETSENPEIFVKTGCRKTG